VFICNLRKKLSAWGVGSLIDTVRGHGYIMRELAENPIASAEMGAASGFPKEVAAH
jgi:hypothetical protein